MNANAVLDKLLSCANRVLPEETGDAGQPFRLPESLLVIPSRFIGDNLLLTPLLRNLRETLGATARMDVAATGALTELYEGRPEIDRVFADPQVRDKKTFLQTYDTVLFCHYRYGWAAAAQQARVPQRIGFDLERLGLQRMQRWGQCLTHAVPSTSALDPRHQADIYLDLLRHFGLGVTPYPPECRLRPEDEAAADRLLAGLEPGRLRVLIHATAQSPGKRWAGWEELLHRLHEDYRPLLLAVGASRDRGRYEPWERAFSLVNLCGRTRLRQSIALMRQVDLVITLDTAIAHMGAVAGTPRLIVLYGPTNPHKWRPAVQAQTALRQVSLGLDCQPCLARTCEHRQCLRGLGVEQVLEAVRQVLAEVPPGARRRSS